MNRIITIAITTLISSAAYASEPAPAPQAPRVDAAQMEADRELVRNVGILGMLNDGDATQAVLSSASIGLELDSAVRSLKGQRFASTTVSLTHRRAPTSSGSVSIGVVKMESARDFELATHRGHAPATPTSR